MVQWYVISGCSWDVRKNRDKIKPALAGKNK
jgi:hypothetical protein